MHPRTAELVEHLDRQHRLLHDAIANTPDARLDAKPAPDRWSVAEVLEHLSIVETNLAAAFRKRLDEARAEGFAALPPDAPSVLASFPLARILDRQQRIEASNAARPKGLMAARTALAAYDSARAAFRDELIAVDGLDVDHVTVPHRIFGNFNVYQWAAFAGGHEARHTGQIVENLEVRSQKPEVSQK